MMWTVWILTFTICTAHAQEWELVWSEEFEGDEINMTTRQYEVTMSGGGNNEFQTYTPATENSYVKNGYLFIKPTLLRDNINPTTGEPFGQDFIYEGTMDLEEIYGVCTESDPSACVRQGQGYGNDTEIPPLASARMRSLDGFSFRYGRAEVRARLPVGDWIWPAIWFLPDNWCYGDWPRSGKFDHTESIGNEDLRFENGTWQGIQRHANAMHWGPAAEANGYQLTYATLENATYDFGHYFHDYTIEWTPEYIRFMVDDTIVLSVPDGVLEEGEEWNGFFEFGNFSEEYEDPWATCNEPMMAPFDTRFHFLLNIAVGGTNYLMSDEAINRGGDPRYKKPWVNGIGQIEAMNDFYDAEEAWYWTWEKEGEGSAMQVDYIRVYKHAGLPDEGEPDCAV